MHTQTSTGSDALGAVVAEAEKKRKRLSALTLDEFQLIHDSFGADVLEVFNLNKAMDARTLTGSPGRAEVKKQLRLWRKRRNA